MRLIVKVQVNSRKNEVEKLDDGHYLVHTTAIPVENQAHKKVLELISIYFGISPDRLHIFRGSNAQRIILEIH